DDYVLSLDLRQDVLQPGLTPQYISEIDLTKRQASVGGQQHQVIPHHEESILQLTLTEQDFIQGVLQSLWIEPKAGGTVSLGISIHQQGEVLLGQKAGQR